MRARLGKTNPLRRRSLAPRSNGRRCDLRTARLPTACTEDVLVSGFDDITLTRYFKPPLTTIRPSGSLLGEVAVDALVATLDNSELADRTVVLPTELVVRESCGCAAQSESPSRDV